MKFISLLLLLLSTVSLNAQITDPELVELIERIADYGQINSQNSVLDTPEETQYKRFEKLKKLTSEKELLELLEHESPAVKGYAVWALVDRQYNDLKTIFTRFLATGETVKGRAHDLISYDQIAAELYQRVQVKYWGRGLSFKDSIKNRTQLFELYHIILRRDTVDFMLSHAFYTNKANPRQYDVIREWALEKELPEALVALAEYQKEEDVETFKNLGHRSFKAIAHFPHPDFRDFLAKVQPEHFGYDFFLAVSAYKDKSALAFLEELYNNYLIPSSTNSHSYTFQKAIAENYIPLYKKLLLRYFEDHGVIENKLAVQFIHETPKIAANSFLKGLMNNEQVFITADLSEGFDTSERVLFQVLNHIKEETSADLTEVCAAQMKSEHFANMEVYTDFAREHGLRGVIPAILKRLQSKNHALDIFHLTQTLLSFEDKEANKQLAVLLSDSREHWDWGNWSKSFLKLFNKYEFSVD